MGYNYFKNNHTTSILEAKHKLFVTIARIDGAYAPSTIRAYQADFIDFIGFCAINHANALPASAEIIASYITHLSNAHRSSASIRRAVSGIATIHTLKDLCMVTNRLANKLLI